MAGQWRAFMSGPQKIADEFKVAEQAGWDIVYGRNVEDYPDGVYDDNELSASLRGVNTYVIPTRERFTRRVAEASPDLLTVIKATIGVDNVDVAAATDHGILVSNSPTPENYVGVAEGTIGFMVLLSKRLVEQMDIIQKGGWKRGDLLGDLMWGKTVGIVGLGRVGGAVAKRLAAWDMRVLVADPYIPRNRVLELGVEHVDLDTLLRESDFVSLHVVLNDETRHMIGERELNLMKPTAFLINTARGAVIDTAAVAKAIDDRRIAGGAFDTHTPEPLPMDSPLRELDPNRVIITPHSIGNSNASHHAGQQMAADTLLRIMRGQLPESVVNPQVIDRWRERLASAQRG
ncbi:MAG: hypothetical protein QOF51_2053 [Chloroflexota bacterium]|nr:hypothetical protein [Chloroflexota bacterium]